MRAVRLCQGDFSIVFLKLIKLDKMVSILAEGFTEIVNKLDNNTETLKLNMELVCRDMDSMNQIAGIGACRHISVNDPLRLTGSLSAASQHPLITGPKADAMTVSMNGVNAAVGGGGGSGYVAQGIRLLRTQSTNCDSVCSVSGPPTESESEQDTRPMAEVLSRRQQRLNKRRHNTPPNDEGPGKLPWKSPTLAINYKAWTVFSYAGAAANVISANRPVNITTSQRQ